ncbi:MAG: glycine betaine ABC transporter substrate-binding protein [Syntrophomonadaceae bacterium]|nr:glycine betaine ABC transporter substrate-binding protein [Syntrophomonadaceae bacterium]
MKSKSIIAVAIITMLMFSVVGCGGSSDVASDSGQQDDKKVRLLYVQWACASAETHIMAEILENYMDYEVEIMDVAAAAMYQGLASKEADAIFTAWLPLTHGDYMKQLGDQLEDLGPNMEGAKIGLVVPEYVTIGSIEEMNSVKDKFKGQIIGIDPGAGIMQASEQALTDYGLDYELVEGSEGTMIMSLKEAIDNEEWVAVTGWTPHWKFARWDLKYLDDPKTVYGEAETINTVVRLGLKEDKPDAYELFDNFAWTPDDLSSAMVLAEELGDPVKAAQQWIDQNQDLVQSWLPEEYKK